MAGWMNDGRMRMDSWEGGWLHRWVGKWMEGGIKGGMEARKDVCMNVRKTI